MRFLNSWKIFESKSYNPKNLILEICTSMVLLNNEFLSNILDRGMSARYQENSSVFLTDLKNLIISRNRLHMGQFVDGKCVSDDETSKINAVFSAVEFNMQEDWDILVSARSIARNIIDKLIPDEKLDPNSISKIFWMGPNKDDNHQEDIVIELSDGKQYSMYLNKSISTQKTASFSLFADDLIGTEIDRLYDEENIKKWDKLTQEWVKLIYENSDTQVRGHIEKFIDTKRIDSIGYFEYFDIRHRDPRFKHLGEYMKEFEKNILKLSDLLNEVWKKRELFFMDFQRVEKEWIEIKMVILNSRILEHLLTTSLKKNSLSDIKKIDETFKMASGRVKMKLLKTIVNKMGCLESPIYYLSNSGNEFHQIPSRSFFRKHYNDINIHFDYHVKFKTPTEEADGDFTMVVKLLIGEKETLTMKVVVKFSGGEFSGKLSAKYKFEIPASFSYIVSKKEMD